jgi:hypothetical protein
MLDPPIKFGRPIDDNGDLVKVLENWGVTLHRDQVLDAVGATNFRQPRLAVCGDLRKPRDRSRDEAEGHGFC